MPKTSPRPITDWLGKLSKRLEDLSQLENGWNGYNAPKPTSLAIEEAAWLLRAFHERDFEPTRLAASAVGGIGFTKRLNGRKAYFEVHNDGQIFCLLSDGKSEPIVNPIRTEASSLRDSIDAAQSYLNEQDVL